MEIPPTKASLDQVVAGKGGKMICIENDVQGIANALNEIDPHLRLRFSEAGGYFVVYWKPDHEAEGFGELVTTATELDFRLVEHVRKLNWKSRQPGYSLADELEAAERERARAADHEFTERHGELYENLAFALRKDKGVENRAFVPRDVEDGDIR